MLRALLPLADAVVFTAQRATRARCRRRRSSRSARQLGGADGAVARPTRAARSRARASSPGAGGVVLATGSIYLVADLLRPPGSAGARCCERRRTVASCR